MAIDRQAAIGSPNLTMMRNMFSPFCFNGILPDSRNALLHNPVSCSAGGAYAIFKTKKK
jgi:hypothetical protein